MVTFIASEAGGFLKKGEYPIWYGGVGTLVLADVNGDGAIDVVTGGGQAVKVLIGNGDGTLMPYVEYPAGHAPLKIVATDVNGDSKLDIVAINGVMGSGTVDVLLGNGDGTFAPSLEMSVAPQPLSLSFGDFNGDGKMDLVVGKVDADYNGIHGYSLAVLLGNGDGTFRVGPEYSVGNTSDQILVADANGDRKLDLVIASGVLLGNGDGTFQPEAHPHGWLRWPAVMADVNGDRKPDLVSPIMEGDVVVVALGHGDGSFEPPSSASEFDAGAGAVALAIADVNHDGLPDLLTATAQSTVSVLLASGNGTFRPPVQYPSGGYPSALAVADVNGDANPDVVTAMSNDTVGVLLGNGDGTFRSGTTWATGSSPQSVAVLDVNHDGAADIITGNYGLGTISVLLGNGDGTFLGHIEYPADGPCPTSVAVGDLNRDGTADIVVADRCSSPNVDVLLGNGDGTFQPFIPYATAAASCATGAVSSSISMADLNGDGKLDVLTTSSCNFDTSVSVMLGNGDGALQPTAVFATGPAPYSSSVADVDGDGHLDILTSAYYVGISVLKGNGDGTFHPYEQYATGTCVSDAAIADLNGDGIPDVATTCGANSVSVLFGERVVLK